MLVLTRKQGESVRIGPDVRVTIVAASGGQVRIAIDAPREIGIFREELFDRVAVANLEAAAVLNTNLGAVVSGPVGQSGDK